jgi:hypothetical protein
MSEKRKITHTHDGDSERPGNIHSKFVPQKSPVPVFIVQDGKSNTDDTVSVFDKDGRALFESGVRSITL